jgi:hypothetical protein
MEGRYARSKGLWQDYNNILDMHQNDKHETFDICKA